MGRKIFIWTLSSLIAIVILSLTVLFLPLGGPLVKKALETGLSSVEGLSGKIDSVSGNPLSGYKVKGIGLFNSDGDPLAEVGYLKVRLDLPKLLLKKISLPEIGLKSVKLNLKGLSELRFKSGKSKAGAAALEVPLIKIEHLAPFSGDWELESVTAAIDSGDISVCCGLSYRGLPVAASLDISGQGESWVLRKGLVKLLAGSGALSGDLLPKLNLSGVFDSLDSGGLSVLFPDLSGKFHGAADMEWKVWGEAASPFAKGSVRLKDGKALGFKLPCLEALWSYKDKAFKIESLRFKTDSPKVFGKCEVRLEEPLFVRGDLYVKSLDLGGPSGKITGNIQISGALDYFALHAAGPAGPGLFPSLSCDIASKAITVRQVPLKNIAMAFNGKGPKREIRLSSFSMALADGEITGSGSADLTSGLKVSLKGGMKGFSAQALADIFPQIANTKPAGDISGTWAVHLDKGEVRAETELSSESMNFADSILLKDSRANLAFDGDVLEVKDFSSNLCGGKVSLSGIIFAKSGALDLKGWAKSLDGGLIAEKLGSLDVKGLLDGKISLTGTMSNPVLDMEVTSDKFDSDPLSIKDLALTVKTQGDRLLSRIKAEVNGSPVAGEGWMRLPSESGEGSMDLEAFVDGLELNKILPKDVRIGGALSAKFHVLGPLDKLKVYGRGTLPNLKAQGMSFVSVDLGGSFVKGEPMDLHGSALFGDRRLKVSCDLLPVGKGLSLDFQVSGKSMDLAALAPALDGVADGRLDLDMTGHFRDGEIRASGSASSSKISSFGLTVGPLELPLEFQGTNLKVKGGKVMAYGGPGSLDLDADLGKNTWKGRAEIKSADLRPLIQDAADLPGSIDGTGDLRLDLSGVAGRAFLMDISGFFKARSIVIKGFPPLKAVTKGEPLKVRDLFANFDIDGKELYILPGSRASAWPGDDVFHYLEASGSVPFEKDGELDMSFSGEVNLNALNAFLGAMKNVFRASIESLKDPRSLATDLLKGIIGGYSSQEFREIRLNLGGTLGSPSISNIRISEKIPVKSENLGEVPTPGGEPRIMIKIDIPTGQGSDSGPDAKDQVKKQIVDHLFEQIIGSGQN